MLDNALKALPLIKFAFYALMILAFCGVYLFLGIRQAELENARLHRFDPPTFRRAKVSEDG